MGVVGPNSYWDGVVASEVVGDEEFESKLSILDFPMESLEGDEFAEDRDASNSQCMGPLEKINTQSPSLLATTNIAASPSESLAVAVAAVACRRRRRRLTSPPHRCRRSNTLCSKMSGSIPSRSFHGNDSPQSTSSRRVHRRRRSGISATGLSPGSDSGYSAGDSPHQLHASQRDSPHQLGADPSLGYTQMPIYAPMYAGTPGYPHMASGLHGSHTSAMMHVEYVQQAPFGGGASGYGAGASGYGAGASGSGVPPVTPEEVFPELDARLLLRAAEEEDVIFYDAPKSSVGSCQSAVGGTSQDQTFTDADSPVLTVAHEVLLVDTIPADAVEKRGSNITLDVTDMMEDRPLVTVTKALTFSDGRAAGVICNNLKKVVQEAHVSFLDFSKTEKTEAWKKFKQTFRWDPRHLPLIKEAYFNIAKQRWYSAVSRAKEFWEYFKKDPSIATSSATWPTREHMREYVRYWAQDDAKKRAKVARDNRLKKGGINHVCGSMNIEQHRQKLAVEMKCTLNKVPQHVVWHRTHCKRQKNGQFKWTSKEDRNVYILYLKLSIRNNGYNTKEWTLPYNKEAWDSANQGPRKNHMAGFGSTSNSERLGFDVYQCPRYFGEAAPVQNSDEAMEQLEVQRKLIEDQAAELVAQRAWFAAHEASVAAQTAAQMAAHENMLKYVRDLYTKLGHDIPPPLAGEFPTMPFSGAPQIPTPMPHHETPHRSTPHQSTQSSQMLMSRQSTQPSGRMPTETPVQEGDYISYDMRHIYR